LQYSSHYKVATIVESIESKAIDKVVRTSGQQIVQFSLAVHNLNMKNHIKIKVK